MSDNLSLFGEGELPLQDKPPSAFRVLPTRLAIDFCCPRCAYGWAGPPLAGSKPVEFDENAEQLPPGAL